MKNKLSNQTATKFLRNCYAFLCMANVIGMELESSNKNNEVPKFAIEFLNYEDTNQPNTDYCKPQSSTLRSYGTNLQCMLQKLQAKNIFDENFEEQHCTLLRENCPSDLKKLINKIENSSNRIPSKILLEGPSGGGKTSLAKLIAKKAKPKAYIVKGSTFGNEYQHSGKQEIAKLFELLIDSNEQIALVIDELTALVYRKKSENDRELDPGMVEEFWTQLDTCRKNKNIFIIGTANEFDKVPESIKTRFSQFTFRIDLPNYDLRGKIITYYLPNFENFRLWQKYWILYKSKGVSIRELEDALEKANITKENDEKLTEYSEVILALNNVKNPHSKCLDSLRKKFNNNAYWIIPFIGNLAFQQFSIFENHSFQEGLTGRNEQFQIFLQDRGFAHSDNPDRMLKQGGLNVLIGTILLFIKNNISSSLEYFKSKYF